MPSTNYDKFCLLLWKNWTLQWNHKWQCLVEICAPVVFSLLLVFVRIFVKSTHFGELRFTKSFEMKDFSLLRENYTGYVDYRVAYSPASCTFCTNIMKEAVGGDIQPCESSSALQTIVADEQLLAGVDFGDTNEHALAYPRKFVFSIRFPSELRSTESVIQIWNTNKLFMPLDPFGPRNRLDEDGGVPAGYLRGGFLTIQNRVSLAYIKLSTANRSSSIPAIKIKRFPYPPFVEDLLLKGLSAIIALIILLCYIQPATYTVKHVALEKEKQLKEVLKIMGLSNWLHWTAWFVKSFVTLFLSTLLIGFFLTTKWSNGVAVITYSSFSTFIFFLLIYVITSITFCFMVATLFNKASTAAAVTGLYWFLSFIPFTYISINYDHMPITSKYLWCFIANTCMGLGTRVIVEWEMTGQGLNWATLFEESSAGDPLKMIHILAMMSATAVIHMLICLYVEQVRPGTYGIPKPWNFPFRKSFWFGESIRNVPGQPASRGRRENAQYFEKEPENKEAGVVISNLSKSFGDKHVVRNLSFNMYRNEITVLLGHNGAGKTTTISILIGMIQPTSGTAYIMGHDIRTDIDGAREYLSICPQHNVLFDDLTVRDHLKFFAYLRGLRGEELEDEVQSYLDKIDLGKKADTLSSNLSGGMQRKLSVSCALCGGPLVVLCDEPSSGMDPTARRQLWNILQQEKEGRIILLTTHFMDEADVLADRIAIMAGGQLKCYGTSFFLKKKVGTGYTLVCVKDRQCDSSAVTAFLQEYIPNLELAEETDTEISYTLEERHSTVFSEMLNGLENASSGLGISGFGLSNTSLEEVFLKMGAETFASDATKTNAATGGVNFSVSTRLRGRDLTSSQIQSMILKKYLSTRRNSALVAVNVVMVLAFVILSVVVKATDLFPRQRPLVIGLQQYKEATVVLETPNVPSTKSMTSDIIKNYERFVRDAGSKYTLIYTRGLPFEAFILNHPVRLQHQIDSKFVAGATIREDEFLVWLNNKPLHSAPLTLNILHNAIARTLLGEHAEIVVINHPLHYLPETRMSVADTGLGLGTQLATNVGFSMSIITALFCVFIIKERQSRAKLLQFVSGVKGLTFWLTHFIWDFTYFTILALVFVVFLGWFEEEAYTHFEELARNFIILLCFAFSALPLTYLMSRRYTEPANGFAKLSMFNIFFGVGVFAIALVLSFEVLDLRDVGHSLETFVLAYPHFALAKAMHSLYINQMLHIVCQPLLALADDQRCERYGHCCKLTPYFAWERPGVGRPIVYLLVSGAIYSFLVISIQYRLLGAMWDKYQSKQALKRHTFEQPKYFDSDVDTERKLIDHMTKAEIGGYNLVMKRLTKFYGNFLAVNQLSVAIKEAECFGLLGLNGAGKSTTFKMLTLDVNTTFGRAYVKGMNIQTQTKDVYQEIGYCPQFGGLFNDFTGRETLRLFAMIHGIPKQRIAQLSENLAKAFGFIKHYDNRVGNYSGGNKRKLSTAVAVIGGPSVVLLDEPTSGMDPASRRRLWNVINSIRKAGKSIVLTSHSMDECVALCTRMGIMVSGEFRCLGSIQHLRIKYSQGLVLKIKVMSIQYSRMARPSVGRRISWRSPAHSREKSVEIWVKANFPDAKLEDKFQGLLSFNIPMSEHLWSRLFGKVEENKQALYIEDYSISQTNLEEIFLYFTKH